MTAWIYSIIPESSDFTIDNLPWGVFKDDSTSGSICVAIGNHVVDVHAWALSWTDELGFGEDFALNVKDALRQASILQSFCVQPLALGPRITRVRLCATVQFSLAVAHTRGRNVCRKP